MDVAGTLRAAIVPAIIAILLSPGLLFNIPPINGKWWMTGQTNLTNVSSASSSSCSARAAVSLWVKHPPSPARGHA